MNDNIITQEMMISDFRSFMGKLRAYKKKIEKKYTPQDLKSRLCQIFDKEGLNYYISDKGDAFRILVTQTFTIVGEIKNNIIKFGLGMNYGGISVDPSTSQCGYIEIEVALVERFVPLFHKMVEDGRALTKRYDSLTKKHKEAGLLDLIVRPYVNQHSIKDVIVITLYKEGECLIKKDIMGISVQARVNFSNYEEIFNRFVSAVNMFPDNLMLRSKHRIEGASCLPSEIVKKNPVDVASLPDNLKIIYSDSLYPKINEEDTTDILQTINSALAHYGYKYSIESDTIVVDLNSRLKLCRKGDTTFYRFLMPNSHKDFLSAVIDESHFIKLLKLLALASQNGCLSIEVTDNYIPLFIETTSKLLDPLFPEDCPLGVNSYGDVALYHKYGKNIFKLSLQGNEQELIDDIEELAFGKEKLERFEEACRKVSADSGIKMFIHMGGVNYYSVTDKKVQWFYPNIPI